MEKLVREKVDNILSIEDALALLTSFDINLPEKLISINEAVNRVAATDLTAAINVPEFPRSRVDGYAISKPDVTKELPFSLKKTTLIAAGDKNSYVLEAGNTIKIMTGAPLPLNTGLVIKQEEVEEGLNDITITKLPQPKANLELTGSLLKKGQNLITKGQVYNPMLIEQLGKTGRNKVLVYERPTVYVVNSGSELVLPGSNLEYGEIYNSNQSLFLSLLKLAGCNSIKGEGQLADNMDLIKAEINKGLQVSDVLIITGGNSEGDYDLIPAALRQLGAKIMVDGLDLRPGNKTVVASLENKLIFNVSGNPQAGYILFNILIHPVIRRLQGMKAPFNSWFNIPLYKDVKNIKQVRYFTRGLLIEDQQQLAAFILRKKEIDYTADNSIKIVAPLILDIPSNVGKAGEFVKATIL